MKIDDRFFEHLVSIINKQSSIIKSECVIPDDFIRHVDILLIQCQTIIREERREIKRMAITERFNSEAFILAPLEYSEEENKDLFLINEEDDDFGQPITE